MIYKARCKKVIRSYKFNSTQDTKYSKYSITSGYTKLSTIFIKNLILYFLFLPDGGVGKAWSLICRFFVKETGTSRSISNIQLFEQRITISWQQNVTQTRKSFIIYSELSLREKCPNTEFSLVLILLYSGWIQENMNQKKLAYSVRTREYTDQKKTRIRTLFTQCLLMIFTESKGLESL